MISNFKQRIEKFEDSKLLQEDLNALILRSENNDLSSNVKKCSYVTFTHERILILTSDYIGKTQLSKLQEVKDLSMILDSEL